MEYCSSEQLGDGQPSCLIKEKSFSANSIDCENLRQPYTGETDNYFYALVEIYHGLSILSQCYRQMAAARNVSLPKLILQKDTELVTAELYASYYEVGVLLVLVLCWTLGRILIENAIFKPLGHFLGVLSNNHAKFVESSWKAVAYSGLWLLSFYVTFFRGHDFFWRPLLMCRVENNASLDLYVVYALEGSFYLHSMYATLYMDAKRKDTGAMLAHHVVTLFLMFASYRANKLTIGVSIFVLVDISDVLLEMGKAFTYLRITKYGLSKTADVTSNVCAALFAVLWVINRLYLHVTKVWRGVTIGLFVSSPELPFILSTLVLETVFTTLYCFYCYWFWFIARMIIRILTMERGKADDPRED